MTCKAMGYDSMDLYIDVDCREIAWEQSLSVARE